MGAAAGCYRRPTASAAGRCEPGAGQICCCDQRLSPRQTGLLLPFPSPTHRPRRFHARPASESMLNGFYNILQKKSKVLIQEYQSFLIVQSRWPPYSIGCCSSSGGCRWYYASCSSSYAGGWPVRCSLYVLYEHAAGYSSASAGCSSASGCRVLGQRREHGVR
jgi:hypothetical protein